MSYQLVSYLDETWLRAVTNVREATGRLWKRPTYFHAVDHGLGHIDRVIALLDGLTEGLMTLSNHSLAQEEIYTLLAAVYLHTIGLQDEHNEPDPNIRWRNYPKLSEEIIYRAIEAPDQAVRLGLIDNPSLVEMIALLVARQHKTDYPSPEYDDFLLGNATMRPRLLVALLHFADALDLDHRRVDMEQLKLMRVSSAEALNWWLHYYVSGVQVANEFVRIGYRVPIGEADYEKLVPQLVERELRTDFDALRDTFWLYGVKPNIGSSGVRPVRVVRPMPADLWAAALFRLAYLWSVDDFLPVLEEPKDQTKLIDFAQYWLRRRITDALDAVGPAA